MNNGEKSLVLRDRIENTPLLAVTRLYGGRNVVLREYAKGGDVGINIPFTLVAYNDEKLLERVTFKQVGEFKRRRVIGRE